MEKIKITKEQEEAYELLLKNSNYDAYRVLSDFSTIRDKQRVYSQYKPLLSLTMEELSHVLNRWYEVEQPFKVGDWVKWTLKDKAEYLKIESMEGNELLFNDNSVGIIPTVYKHIEKIEEPWKIMLLELGRDKPEFKIGDKYTAIKRSLENFEFTVYTPSFEMHEKRFEKGEVTQFYPVESRIEVKQ